MRSFDELIKESSLLHGHLCAGQVLGVRMAMVGCREVEIEEPRGCKKLLVYVEMDRCATDAIQAVTGCSLGKRSLKFLDYGKMAATFINLATKKAVRIVAKDDARSMVSSYVNDTPYQHEAERKAYALMPEASLFSIRPVTVQAPDEDIPGVRSRRVFCERCGEGINFKREIKRGGRILCIPCAQGSYLPENGRHEVILPSPGVITVVGSSKSGKTTLIEKLIPELSARGHRVGTIKHHHSHFPLEVDCEGKDSWRHRKAGAKAVVLVSPRELVLFQNLDEMVSLDEAVKYLKGMDIVLVEGFRLEAKPRIEVRPTRQKNILQHEKDGCLLALVSSEKLDGGVPCFSPDEIRPLADLIEKEILGQSSPSLGLRSSAQPKE